MTASDPFNQYLGSRPVDVEVNGRHLQVTVHFAFAQRRVTCVGFDVRSFTGEKGSEQRIEDEWTEITSPLLRGIRTAEVISAAAAKVREEVQEIQEQLAKEEPGLFTPELVADLGAGMFPEGDRPRRGPKPQLDEVALRDVVAPAYLGAPSKPAQAVREALLASGLLGRIVTPDQARKAVVAARARGFIPPAKRPGK